MAKKEYNNEKILNNIDEEWNKYSIELDDYKVDDSFILNQQQVDDFEINLEENLMKIQTMKGSKFAVNYITRITEMEEKLILIDQNFHLWLKVQ